MRIISIHYTHGNLDYNEHVLFDDTEFYRQVTLYKLASDMVLCEKKTGRLGRIDDSVYDAEDLIDLYMEEEESSDEDDSKTNDNKLLPHLIPVRYIDGIQTGDIIRFTGNEVKGVSKKPKPLYITKILYPFNVNEEFRDFVSVFVVPIPEKYVLKISEAVGDVTIQFDMENKMLNTPLYLNNAKIIEKYPLGLNLIKDQGIELISEPRVLEIGEQVKSYIHEFLKYECTKIYITPYLQEKADFTFAGFDISTRSGIDTAVEFATTRSICCGYIISITTPSGTD